MNKDNKDLNEMLETEELALEAEAEAEATEEAVEDKKVEKKADKKKSNGGIKKIFTARKFKKGGFSIAVTAVFVVAVILLNMIAVVATNKIPALSVDLSEQQAYDLSQDTIDFLETVNKDVTITVLASKTDFEAANQYYKMASILIDKMHNVNKKIKITYVDLTANPTFVNKYKDEDLGGGEFIVSCGEKYRVLSPTEDLFEIGYTSDYTSTVVQGVKVEPAVTTAILNVTSENQTKVQFIEGFGKTSIYSDEPFKNLLKQNNYDVSTVSTLTEEIASDAQALVLFTPTVDLDEASVEKIKKFLNNNGEYGKSLIYVACEEEVNTPNLAALIEEWGMKLSNGVAAETDTSRLLTNSYYISISDYENAEYTQGLKDSSLPTIIGYTRPVEITNANSASALLTTSEMAKLVPFGSDESFAFDGVEPAKYNAAAVGSKVSGEEGIASNVVVFGSALVFDEYTIKIPSANNGSYIVNLVNKVTDNQDEGIAISGKDLTNPSLGITTDQIYSWAIVCAGVIPVMIIIVAVIIWLRRRNK